MFSPLYSFIFSIIFKKHLGMHGMSIILVFHYLVLNSALFFFFFYWDISLYSGTLVLSNWFLIGNSSVVDLAFHCDFLSFTMSWLVAFLGFFALMYGYDYCRDEPNGDRVLLLLNAFIFAMLGLFNAYNFLVFITAWEGTGLVTCLLINYWNTKINSLKSSLKSFVVNRFGDFGLLFFCYIVASRVDNFNFSTFLLEAPILSREFIDLGFTCIPFLDFALFFLVLAVFTKSAQFSFHSWLPDAMEAPTPASALIHSSAMVVAGVYLLMRVGDALVLTNYVKYFCAFIGSITAFYSGLSACYQVDLKKILAYSTVSHLGLMVGCCGSGYFDLALVYLLNHSLSKCLLFFCAGVVIVYFLNIQDIRRMGGSGNYLPIVFFSFMVGSFSLIGWPFFNGFFVKHLLIEAYLITNWSDKFFFSSFLLAGTFTLVYCGKSCVYIYLSIPRGYVYMFKKAWLVPTFYKNKLSYRYWTSQGALSLIIMLTLIFMNVLGLDSCILFFRFFSLSNQINLSFNSCLGLNSVGQFSYYSRDAVETFYLSWAFVFSICSFALYSKKNAPLQSNLNALFLLNFITFALLGTLFSLFN